MTAKWKEENHEYDNVVRFHEEEEEEEEEEEKKGCGHTQLLRD